MDNRLRRMFDQVKMERPREEAILGDILSGTGGLVPDQRRTRAIPRFALMAAVLVFVMAGTAAAIGYFGRVRIEESDHPGGGRWDGSYRAYMSDCVIPLDSLSAEVRDGFSDGTGPSNYISFKSWADAEAFLGLELADNAQLDQMVKSRRIQYKPGGDSKLKKAHTHCLMSVNLPWTVSISAFYEKLSCTVTEEVLITTDYETEDPKNGWQVFYKGEVAFSEYTTPNGLEVSICKDVTTERSGDCTAYSAYFVKNNALFQLTVRPNQVWNAGRQEYEFADPWDTLVEILDAYE